MSQKNCQKNNEVMRGDRDVGVEARPELGEKLSGLRSKKNAKDLAQAAAKGCDEELAA